MVNPLVFTTKIEENERIYPIYSAIKGMSSQFLEDKMKKAIQLLDKEDFLEPTLQKSTVLLQIMKRIKCFIFLRQWLYSKSKKTFTFK